MKTQYGKELAQDWGTYKEYKRISTAVFYNHLPESLRHQKLLDLGCGSGEEFHEYRRRGVTSIVGLDASPEMVCQSRQTGLADLVVCSSIESASEVLKRQRFDLIVSKWALQHVSDYDLVFENTLSLLEPDGEIVFLFGHPVRQFMEKKRYGKDYFKQELVHSVLFDGRVTVTEPSHSFEEILSKFFLCNFDLLAFEEGFENGCEMVNGDRYPSYILIKAKRR